MKRTMLECCHVDTCLPDYWSGHHLPHVQVPVDRRTTFADLRRDLLSELSEGAVMGSDDMAQQLAAWEEGVYAAAQAAVRRIKPATKGRRYPFRDLEPQTENSDSVYAYFVFCPLEP